MPSRSPASCTTRTRVPTAKIVNGRLDVPEGSLQEGDMVTLLVPEAEVAFDLSAEERAELTEVIAQIDRGEGIDGAA
jgi:hypothetical protein